MAPPITRPATTLRQRAAVAALLLDIECEATRAQPLPPTSIHLESFLSLSSTPLPPRRKIAPPRRPGRACGGGGPDSPTPTRSSQLGACPLPPTPDELIV
ncbi:hypothetical protein ACP70R_017747 [Stipagrostis hirtigluma subsp. patula]